MSMFTLVVSVLLVMCVVKVLTIKRYHSFAGPFKVEVKRMEKCPPWNEGIHAASYDVKERKRRNASTAFDATLELPFVVDDTLVLTGNLASWSNNGGWKPNAYLATIRTPCTLAFQHVKRHLDYGMNYLFGETLSCPFFPGIYKVTNVTIPDNLRKSSSTSFINQFVYGRWRAEGRAYTKDSEMVVCGRAYAETLPN